MRSHPIDLTGGKLVILVVVVRIFEAILKDSQHGSNLVEFCYTDAKTSCISPIVTFSGLVPRSSLHSTITPNVWMHLFS